MTDLEFVVCPRCGTGLDSDRASADICYLCLQEPSLEFSREILIEEQGAVEEQLKEAQDLFREREARITALKDQLEEAHGELAKRRLELDFQTKSYVSEQAARIAAAAARRARLSARSEQLAEYLKVLAKIDTAQQLAAQFSAEKDAIEQDLMAATAESGDSHLRVSHLKERFNEMLERLKTA